MTGNMGERRRYIRYNPNTGATKDLTEMADEHIAYIDLKVGGEFEPSLIGFLVQKSHAGCCLVLPRMDEDSEKLIRDHKCTVKAGPLHPLPAVVRWRRDLDDELMKAGFQFTE